MKTNSTSKVRLLIYIVLTVLMMVIIFVQSALPADLSQMESDFLSDFLARLFRLNPELASFIVRKFAHFLEYTILGVLLALTVRELGSVRKHRAIISLSEESAATSVPAESDSASESAASSGSPEVISRKRHLFLLLNFIAWLIGTFYALTDEFHQNFVEGRSCEFRDLCIDSAGALLGILIIYLIIRRRQKY